tara:strand:+ start:442 stop:1176 length:735 start_codon:yes stop_codon:yes gene_type:complete
MFKEKIDLNNLPNHIAIIMDGNGRWAQTKGKIRIFGHQNGVNSVKEVVEAASEIGIKFLTLYAFSQENWNRPRKEIELLMKLLISTINQETNTLIKNNIKLKAIGETTLLPKECQNELKDTIRKTEKNTQTTLILALSYSGRREIINAIKNIIKDKVDKSKMNEEVFSQYLDTKNVPNPELLIRTSGEQRISNFLLWQIAYSELYFTDKLWPDFTKEDFFEAIVNFQNRERRFGKISKQIKKRN